MIPIDVSRTAAQPIRPDLAHFHYVDQGNYLTMQVPSSGDAIFTLYSDSATSCIITVLFGSKGGQTEVSIAHLDSPGCIQAFFDVVKRRDYDVIEVFAQGANPPDNETSIENAGAFEKVLAGLQVERQELFLLEGDPREDNRGDFGANVSARGAQVTNQPYTLELTERDPTCGGQTVYCIMRRQEDPPQQIRDAGAPFTFPELVELSQIALSFSKDPNDPSTAFTNIVNMESEAIRESWSTTPQYEAPWFSDQLKMGAAFAVSMAPVVSLSAYHLLGSGETTFARMKSAIAETRLARDSGCD